MPATPVWLASIEALLNRGMDGSAPAGALAGRLNATALRVEIEGLTTVRASVVAGRLTLIAVSRSTDPAVASRDDAVISGSPFALLNLARGSSNRGPKTGTVQIRGDAEVANGYRQLFALARPDLEEELSRIVGDLPARRLALLAGQTLAWARNARRTAGENVAEYLQEESRDLVNQPELEEFLHGVDALRETADRVEARLARLEQRLKGSA
ncbi:MAG: ubiquinone biosynthesis accessory factor UbiJ [Gammaproteobacteria bacterium]|jgi:ubiquinone biosynthesis protein UbiJ|nr:ubiquinone biosynthesis accessory factor UbiJ [Gammaproteobacteria bacterium]